MRMLNITIDLILLNKQRRYRVLKCDVISHFKAPPWSTGGNILKSMWCVILGNIHFNFKGGGLWFFSESKNFFSLRSAAEFFFNDNLSRHFFFYKNNSF